MSCDWDCLPEHRQLELAHQALLRAAATLAAQAEVLADEMENGTLADHGGPDALRLFAAVVRHSGEGALAPAGHA